MENWGPVTYREILLVTDPWTTSTLMKGRIALVITHELAHMWFGKLVTMVSVATMSVLNIWHQFSS